MVELIVLGAFALSLFVCVGLGVSILYALILGFVLFCGYGVYRGHSLREMLSLALSGIRTVKGILLTFLLTVIVDLTVAIEIGLLLSVVLFVRRVMKTSYISKSESDKVAASENEESLSPDDTPMLDIPNGVSVYEISGPFFFGLANRFEEFEQRSGERTQVRIIRMRKVPFIDSTGVNNLKNLIERNQKRGIKIILSGVNPTVQGTLHKFGLDKTLSDGCIQPHIIPALAKAKELLH